MTIDYSTFQIVHSHFLTGSLIVVVSSSEQIESSCIVTDCSMYAFEGGIGGFVWSAPGRVI